MTDLARRPSEDGEPAFSFALPLALYPYPIFQTLHYLYLNRHHLLPHTHTKLPFLYLASAYTYSHGLDCNEQLHLAPLLCGMGSPP